MQTPSRPEMMPLILEAIEDKGYLEDSDLEAISEGLRIPSSRVYGFSTQFGDLPKRSHKALLRVCSGPACALHGSGEILDNLRERLPEDVEVLEDPGLARWHGSAAVSIQLAGEEPRVLEGLTPGDVDTVVAALQKADIPGAKLLHDAGPPSVNRLPGFEVSPWWASAEKGDLPTGWGPDLIRWVSENPDRAMQWIEDYSGTGSIFWKHMVAMREVASGGSPAPVIVCDTIGAEAENSVDQAATLLHPRAVVAGAALAVLACRASGIIFYVSWEDTQTSNALYEAQAELLHDAGIKASVVRGPRHVPCSLDIGRSAVIQGVMLWRAAAEYGWGGARLGVRPLILLPAELAMRLPWVIEGVAKKGQPEEGTHLVSLAGCVDNPLLLEVPLRTTVEELVSSLDMELAGSGLKAVQALGMGEGPVPYAKEDVAVPDAASGLLLLSHSICMVEWARYLSRRAEFECCGGCVPGRTAAAAARRIITSLWRGQVEETQEAEWRDVASISEAAGKLALCPRLREVLRPVISCLNNFGDEFSAHAVDGSCKAGACVLPARTGTLGR